MLWSGSPNPNPFRVWSSFSLNDKRVCSGRCCLLLCKCGPFSPIEIFRAARARVTTVMASSVSLDQLVVDFLRKRGFLKTLKSFMSETGLVRAFFAIFFPIACFERLGVLCKCNVVQPCARWLEKCSSLNL